MPCYHPMTAYRSRTGRDPKTGKWPVVFNITRGYSDMEVTVPCGQCIGCRLERSRQWAVRCVHEASLYDNNCFITLTYRDENLPTIVSYNPDTESITPFATLEKRNFVLFMKKLRKRFGDGIRFFQCGEYGEHCKICGLPRVKCRCKSFQPSLGRPHHHAIIFNFEFPDKELWSTRQGVRLYRSKILEELWPYGFCTIGDVTFESAAYVARYVTKKITGVDSDQHYLGRLPEYITMSRRPGIAREWFTRFYSDVYPSDSVVVRPGLIARPPKYYDKIYDLYYGEEFAKIKHKRINLAKLSADNTFERLAVREHIQYVKFDKLIRPLN